MSVADPKPEKRIRDKDVYARFHELHVACLVCGESPITAAHLLRGTKREDVLAGLIPLCGDGSQGCHGAFDSGHKYTDRKGRTITPRYVKHGIAEFLRSDLGERNAAYLISRLGPFGAEAYVQKLEQA